MLSMLEIWVSLVMKHNLAGSSGDGAQALCLSHRQVCDVWNRVQLKDVMRKEQGNKEKGKQGKRFYLLYSHTIACCSVVALLL